ncbi:hypothetical protein BZG74_08555 [Salinivibrio sharmensis]|uniref:Endonuclease/exonuclease/phosphatase domain-containing protein n=2 Tax=Salinivibrio sharmensis TaxID=390883 RepID=A0ABX3KH58_9GAMM|nr:hypothetical protein BZG74_08555 [Salinivibrio sharmensis]
MANIEKKFPEENIKWLSLADAVGRSRFDIGVAYNHSRVSIEHKDRLIEKQQGNYIKAAQHVKLTNLDDGEEVNIFLCHWPSRLLDENREKRREAAKIVSHSAKKLMENGEHVIVMGDFNSNPYHDEMNVTLKATRCHETVKKYHDELFYNPFWRSMIPKRTYHYTNSEEPFRSGTIKGKPNNDSMWNSFDQIIVSGSFLQNKDWHLHENQTRPIEYQELLNHFDDKNCFIDHLPVVCEIQRA